MSDKRTNVSVKSDHIKQFAHLVELVRAGPPSNAVAYLNDHAVDFQNLGGALNLADRQQYPEDYGIVPQPQPSLNVDVGDPYPPNSGRIRRTLDCERIYALPIPIQLNVNLTSGLRVQSTGVEHYLQHQVCLSVSPGDFSGVVAGGTSGFVIMSPQEVVRYAGRTLFYNLRFTEHGIAFNEMLFEAYLQ